MREEWSNMDLRLLTALVWTTTQASALAEGTRVSGVEGSLALIPQLKSVLVPVSLGKLGSGRTQGKQSRGLQNRIIDASVEKNPSPGRRPWV